MRDNGFHAEEPPLTPRDLEEIRAEMYQYCVQDLHMGEHKAREWAQRSITAITEPESLFQGRPE